MLDDNAENANEDEIGCGEPKRRYVGVSKIEALPMIVRERHMTYGSFPFQLCRNLVDDRRSIARLGLFN
eukprot:scaffold3400_cov169-Amphora_coffeaeformis.AAC.20